MLNSYNIYLILFILIIFLVIYYIHRYYFSEKPRHEKFTANNTFVNSGLTIKLVSMKLNNSLNKPDLYTGETVTISINAKYKCDYTKEYTGKQKLLYISAILKSPNSNDIIKHPISSEYCAIVPPIELVEIKDNQMNTVAKNSNINNSPTQFKQRGGLFRRLHLWWCKHTLYGQG